MTVNPAPIDAPARKMSVSSLLSLICGILSCMFFPAFLAILLGIVGLVRTANPLKKGRWMAVVGILLGVIGIGGYAMFGGGILLLIKGTEGPRVATHDFIEALAAGDTAKAKTLVDGWTDDDLALGQTRVQAHGNFVSTTFNSTSINNSSAEVEGSAVFSSGKTRLEAKLVNSGGWKVKSFQIDPPGAPER